MGTECENCGRCRLSKEDHEKNTVARSSVGSQTAKPSISHYTNNTIASEYPRADDVISGHEARKRSSIRNLESFVEGSGWKCDGKNFCDGNCKASKWMIGGGTCLAGAGSVMILQGLGNGIVDFSNADIVAGSSEVGPFGNWVFLGLFVIVAFTLILGWCCHKSSYNN